MNLLLHIGTDYWMDDMDEKKIEIEDEVPEIPENCKEFAKELGELADKYGIDRCEASFRPSRNIRDEEYQYLQDDIKVTFWATDGRGRPSRNIRIYYQIAQTLALEFAPESFN